MRQSDETNLFTAGVQPFDFNVNVLISLSSPLLVSIHQPDVG